MGYDRIQQKSTISICYDESCWLLNTNVWEVISMKWKAFYVVTLSIAAGVSAFFLIILFLFSMDSGGGGWVDIWSSAVSVFEFAAALVLTMIIGAYVYLVVQLRKGTSVVLSASLILFGMAFISPLVAYHVKERIEEIRDDKEREEIGAFLETVEESLQERGLPFAVNMEISVSSTMYRAPDYKLNLDLLADQITKADVHALMQQLPSSDNAYYIHVDREGQGLVSFTVDRNKGITESCYAFDKKAEVCEKLGIAKQKE